jgi:hypothetical protein
VWANSVHAGLVLTDPAVCLLGGGFTRAKRGGNLVVAEATTKELPPLNLTDALDLTMLIARTGTAPAPTRRRTMAASLPRGLRRGGDRRGCARRGLPRRARRRRGTLGIKTLKDWPRLLRARPTTVAHLTALPRPAYLPPRRLLFERAPDLHGRRQSDTRPAPGRPRLPPRPTQRLAHDDRRDTLAALHEGSDGLPAEADEGRAG